MKKSRKTAISAFLAVLTAVLLFALCACGTLNAASAKTKMEKGGYTVANFSASPHRERYEYSLGMTDIQQGILASKEDGSDDYVFAIWFATEAKAKESLAVVSDRISKISGKMIYFGSEQGVKDFETLTGTKPNS